MTSIRNRLQFSPHSIALIDIAAIATWGILLLEYWIHQKLTLLIHPNYIPLSVITGFLLLAIAVYRIWTLLQIRKSKQPLPAVEHLSILPPGIGSLLLLIVAILGLVITPKAFASQTALQRGVGEVVTLPKSNLNPSASPSNPSSARLSTGCAPFKFPQNRIFTTARKSGSKASSSTPKNSPRNTSASPASS